MKSIMQNEKMCYVCGQRSGLEKHHIYFGAKRKIADEHGMWVWLCKLHHTGSNMAVHSSGEEGRMLNKMLKSHCQLVFEEDCHGTREDFVDLIGRNYL